MIHVAGGPPLPPGIGIPPVPTVLGNPLVGASIPPPPPSPIFNP